ncbi:nitrite/sulfite reductase [Cellulomonas marina]|uniref:assimilatory sulfite reductase (ferredoxin) n=1 Tax=Cellulomonas marina TaxID=988821 RepID=A0A1I0XQV3_9CELL|nr:nitrite/sulfite reductase [Cellulomonas marina]GIG30057.1 sulfite reductase [Cellulomonas marina]SFB02836.1 sulfite reductase (ferredoxin) [Cellulomonas marina]
MSADTTSTPRAAGRPTRTQDHGQWALGSREPLNPNERFKQEDDGLNVRARIEEVYAREGFASIAPQDLRGRMRWWGLYTQRKPGIDGGRTAVLEPHELDDEYFMLRVRLDGGRLTVAQTRAVAEVSRRFARSTADITDRQNIQLHWVRIEDVPEIWRALEGAGLSTTEACGDTPRVVLGSPVAGVAADEIIDGTPAIDAITERYVGDPAFSNLPRKFKTAISGNPHLDVVHEINDVSFVGVVHPEHGPGFDVWVGGGLSTSAHVAQRLGAWVPLAEVPEVWAGVIGIFRDYGYRRLRNRARLKYLVADWGAQRFRDVLETEYLHRPLLDGPAPAPAEGRRDHLGVHRQKDGRFYVGVSPTVGRISGEVLDRVADLVEAAGSDRVRLTVEQKLLVLDVAADRVDALVAGLAGLGLHADPSEFRRGTIACTGIEYCKLAIVETKARAARTVAALEAALPTFEHPLTINVNGCPNSCARIQTADIGLKGQIVTDDEGRQVEGFQVHLGGTLGGQASFGRKLRGHKVVGDELPAYVERLARAFEAGREADETFAQWVQRADEEVLR